MQASPVVYLCSGFLSGSPDEDAYIEQSRSYIDFELLVRLLSVL